MGQPGRVPGRAWVVTGAGVAVNLCLDILYAWSVWKGALLALKGASPGDAMDGANVGWHYLSDAEATWGLRHLRVHVLLFMIPGGRLQDRYGPRVSATLAASARPRVRRRRRDEELPRPRRRVRPARRIGMGLGYAAATPAAVRWFRPPPPRAHRRARRRRALAGPRCTSPCWRRGSSRMAASPPASFAGVVVGHRHRCRGAVRRCRRP